MPVQARLIGRLLVNHSPCASAIRCRIMPYLIKAAPQAAPRAGASARPLPCEGRPGARRPQL